MGARGASSFALLAVVLGTPVGAAGQYVLAERDVARDARPTSIGPRTGSRQDDAYLFTEHDDALADAAWVDISAPGNFNDFSGMSSCTRRAGEPGDYVESHHLLLHPDDDGSRRAVVLFTGKILGVQTSSDCLYSGDAVFANPTFLTYPGFPGMIRGLDNGSGDVMQLFEGMQGVSFKLEVDPWGGLIDGSDWDDVRFVVAPAEGPFSPPTELELLCRVFNETPTTVDVEISTNFLSGLDVRDGTFVVLLPPGAMPTTPLPDECLFVPTQDLIRCFDSGPLDSGGGTGVVTITRGEGGQIVAGAVTPDQESDYRNNRCALDVAATGPDAGVPDTGVADTGVLPDAAAPDSAVLLDTGTGFDGGGGPNDVSFRGVGGCACRAAPTGRDAPTLAILLFVVLALSGWKEPS